MLSWKRRQLLAGPLSSLRQTGRAWSVQGVLLGFWYLGRIVHHCNRKPDSSGDRLHNAKQEKHDVWLVIRNILLYQVNITCQLCYPSANLLIISMLLIRLWLTLKLLLCFTLWAVATCCHSGQPLWFKYNIQPVAKGVSAELYFCLYIM